MEFQTIRIAGPDGARDVPAILFGVWAATQIGTYDDGDDAWTLTHVPTGMRFSEDMTAGGAFRAARMVNDEFPGLGAEWPFAMEGWPKGERPINHNDRRRIDVLIAMAAMLDEDDGEG